MIRYLDVGKVLRLHRAIIAQSGGLPGLRDAGALESAVAQPRMSFGGRDLYTSLTEKAAAIGFSLVANHPFIDGNKRVGQAATEALLLLNGQEIAASVDEQEAVILSVASGEMDRESFARWLATKVRATER